MNRLSADRVGLGGHRGKTKQAAARTDVFRGLAIAAIRGPSLVGMLVDVAVPMNVRTGMVVVLATHVRRAVTLAGQAVGR